MATIIERLLGRDVEIEGRLHPRFAPVAKVLERLLRRYEGGAAICVYHHGECVVDLWGGVRDSQGRPWRRAGRGSPALASHPRRGHPAPEPCARPRCDPLRHALAPRLPRHPHDDGILQPGLRTLRLRRIGTLGRSRARAGSGVHRESGHGNTVRRHTHRTHQRCRALLRTGRRRYRAARGPRRHSVRARACLGPSAECHLPPPRSSICTSPLFEPAGTPCAGETRCRTFVS